MILRVIIAALFTCHLAMAQTDLSATGFVRSYPLSGLVYSDFGHSFKLWQGQDDAMFGYIRPFGEVGIVPSYYHYSYGLDVFPVSFFGVRLRQLRSKLSQDLQQYDCQTNECQGEFKSHSFEFFLAGKVSNYFIVARYKSMKHEKSDASTQSRYVHSGSSLLLDASGENQLDRSIVMLGMDLNDSSKLSVLNTSIVNSLTKDNSQLTTVNWHYKLGEWKLFAGVGVFNSPLKEKATTIVFKVERNILERLGYF